MLTFDVPPRIPLWRAAFKRRRDGDIPRIEATAARIPTDAAAYAAFCGFPAGDPLPITWPAVAAGGLQLAVTTAPAFPLPLFGIVHARQRIVRRRFMRASDTLSARCWVEGHRVVRSGGEFDLVVEVSGDTWQGITTVYTRSIQGHGGARAAPIAPPVWTPAHGSTWELPGDLGWRYCAVGGDYNPIHLSPWTSRPFGYRRPIIHGWWALARALAEMGDAVPETCTVEARFVGVMPLPGQLRFHWGRVEDGSVRFEIRGAEGPCVVGAVRAGAPDV